MAEAEFTHQELGPDVELFSHVDERFKTTRVDLFLSTPLRRGTHTRVALIGRLLERGTRRLSDLQRLNSFLDELYGANFAVEVEALGDYQLLHLCLEVVASRFLPGGEDLLPRGVSFLGEVLAEPVTEDRGFARPYLRQEKKALGAYIRSLANDKSAYAHRRCLEAMCGDDPCALPAHGDPADFGAIGGRNLLGTHLSLLEHSPIAVFLCGQPAAGFAEVVQQQLVRWARHPSASHTNGPTRVGSAETRELFEAHEVSQGRLVLGYWTGVGMADEDYPALVLFNALFGGEAQSLLFRQVRELAGLCYQIGSHLEPLCGQLFVEAGIEPGAYSAVRDLVDHQLDALRQGAFAEADLRACRQLLQRNLWALDDSTDGLVRFLYQQRLAGLALPRQVWHQRLGAVDAQAVVRVAGKVRLDASFFLYPAQGGWRP